MFVATTVFLNSYIRFFCASVFLKISYKYYVDEFEYFCSCSPKKNCVIAKCKFATCTPLNEFIIVSLIALVEATKAGFGTNTTAHNTVAPFWCFFSSTFLLIEIVLSTKVKLASSTPLNEFILVSVTSLLAAANVRIKIDHDYSH